jgi:glycosyltransferase involved in cell wall biosynthesis|tara:strand:+ start:620 stop:1516 length:897 start_codon:yes stop_codon:yes gene_type:complete
MKKSKNWSNNDTYQTIKEINVSSQDPSEPIWFKEKTTSELLQEGFKEEQQIKLCVGTPVHSEVSIHYTQCLLEIQKDFIKNGDSVSFLMHKSSLITQGRNLTVASFLETDADYLLFLDSDIAIGPHVIRKMIDADKDVICVPYPLKSIQWGKLKERFERGLIKTEADMETGVCSYPVRLEDATNIVMNNGIIEITHAPAGCLLIKRSVFEKLIKAYPDRNIKQKSVINGEYEEKQHYYNFFDTVHDKETKTYMGEDFGFCKLWKDINGKIFAVVDEYIMHVGEHQYIGRFRDEFIKHD